MDTTAISTATRHRLANQFTCKRKGRWGGEGRGGREREEEGGREGRGGEGRGGREEGEVGRGREGRGGREREEEGEVGRGGEGREGREREEEGEVGRGGEGRGGREREEEGGREGGKGGEREIYNVEVWGEWRGDTSLAKTLIHKAQQTQLTILTPTKTMTAISSRRMVPYTLMLLKRAFGLPATSPNKEICGTTYV